MKTNETTTLETVREIFLRALEKSSAVERNAFLDGACGSNLELRTRVNELLENHLQDSFLERSPVENDATLNEPTLLTESEGSQIGRYKLLQRIGEGGMGAVFMAEQIEPVRRKVALKIIKLGMDTKSVVARFEAERQALALMDHPNIAKVLDAGSTETGRPYFVMELVKGVPISTYCDKNQLSTKERLELFTQVCKSIQHAHQKGVIHRDIKPSNILVTLHDGKPVPKVIDFGIAKATNQRLTEKTLFTNFAQMIGTPAYMSPEQAEMSGLDVDTRTDVYSLGVLLYELLTGSPPFPEKELLSKGYGEMQRIIAEQEPERPSLRMSTLVGEQQTIVTKSRAGDLPLLTKQLRGDLDWIVMKSLEKDRTRRYDTANGLAEDIQRHLSNEPVLAAKPSFRYQIAKLYYRHKPAFAAAAGITLAMVIGTVAATAQALRANRLADDAVLAQSIAESAKTTAELAQMKEGELREEAQRQTNNALQLAETQRLNIYASDMRLADEAVKAHDYAGAREILLQHLPTDETQTDLRGFEWRLLWHSSKNRALKSVSPRRGTDESDSPPQVTEHRSLTLSPDRKTLLVSYEAEGIRVLSYPDLTPQRALKVPSPNDKVGRLQWWWSRFSPDGSRLYLIAKGTQTSFSPLRWLVAYDTRTWNRIATIETKSISPILLSDSGDPILQVGNFPEDLSQWRKQTTYELTQFKIAADGSYETSPTLSGLPRVSPAVEPWYKQFAGHSRIAVNLQESGRYSPDKPWLVYDTTNSRQPVFLAEISRSFMAGYEFSPSGEFFANATNVRRHRVELKRLTDQHPIRLDPMGQYPFTGIYKMVFTEDSRHLIAADGGAGILHVWNTESGEHRGVIGDQPGRVMDLVVVGDHVTCLYADGQIRTWDWSRAGESPIPFDPVPVIRGDFQSAMRHKPGRVKLQIDGDGSSPAFLKHLSPELRKLFQENVLPWKIPFELSIAMGDDGFRKRTSNWITPDGRYLAICHIDWINEDPEPNPSRNENPELSIWTQKTRLFRFFDLEANDTLIAEWETLPWSTDNEYDDSVPLGTPAILNDHLLLTPFDGYLELWDLRRPERKRLALDVRLALAWNSRAHGVAVADVYENHLVLAQSRPHARDRILIWDIQAEKVVADLGEFADRLFGLRFSPDGQHLFVGGYDCDALVIELGTGKVLTRLKGHRGGVTGEFSPDGRTLLTSTENMRYLWNVATGRKMIQFSESNVYASRPGHLYRFSLDGNSIYSGTSYLDENARPYYKLVTVPTLAKIDKEIAQSR